MNAQVENEIADLAQLQPKELKAKWGRVYQSPAPKLSPTLLRSGIAWKLQEAKLGGHSKAVLRLLSGKRDAANAAGKLSPGTRLVRDWHGTGHTVTVLESGFDYDGRTWRSLTAIARHITGAKWSGPRFFGVAR